MTSKYTYQLQSEGNRHVARYAYKGHPIDIVTGYDIVSDKWPIHIDIDGKRLEGFAARADNRAEAIDFGIDTAIREIDNRTR